MRTGILGGGLAGLTLGASIHGDCEVLEAEDRPGGLCRTFGRDGFSYDIGGHILFSRDDALLRRVVALLGDNVEQRRRANKILFNGRMVKYPFENGLGDLERQDIYDCLIGYLRNPHTGRANFREWILSTFGAGIGEKYLIPYNEKIWKHPLDQMGLSWVERVPKPPLEDVVKSALGFETEGYTHQLFFSYPRTGGIESLIRSVRERVRLLTLNFHVRGIRRAGSTWEVTDGLASRIFDRLVICFPLPEAIKCLPDVPEPIRAAAAGLRTNAVTIVMIGLEGSSLPGISAVYLPDRSVLAHRVCGMHHFSPWMAPPGGSTLIAEITGNPGDGVYDLPDKELTDRVVADLTRLGFFLAKQVVATEVRRMRFGYLVDTLAYTAQLKAVREYVGSIGIDLCGRFGEFEYINMDETLRRAWKLADRLNAA